MVFYSNNSHLVVAKPTEMDFFALLICGELGDSETDREIEREIAKDIFQKVIELGRLCALSFLCG